MKLTFPHFQRIFDARYMLLSKKITFQSGKGENIEVDAVYQDTHPDGNARATVFALHGSPGSYKNFKHIATKLVEKNIRLVAPNYPGHSLTANDHRLTWTNPERNNFAQQIIDNIHLTGKKDLIFLGHSKGAPNALQLGLQHTADTLGIVLLNSTGVLPHRGYRHSVLANKIAQKMRRIKLTKSLGEGMIHMSYNKILRMRVPQKEAAVVAAQNMLTFDFEGLTKDIEQFLSTDEIRLFLAFSGEDLLIEREVSEDLVKRFGSAKRFDYFKENDEKTAVDISKAFREGNKIVAAFFEKDDHFVNNSRPETVVEAIDAIVKAKENAK